MRPQDVIRKKRDGESLTRDEIKFFVDGVASGSLADYQASALLMAILLKGMSADETAMLTDAMLHSGEILDFSDIPKPKVDKHSTGGVGDKTSLILAPLVACCGANEYVGAQVCDLCGKPMTLKHGRLGQFLGCTGYPECRNIRKIAKSGAAVPMISGRGLGHTGGTLDKLESIPGYRVHLSVAEFRKILKRVGFAMMGQTAEIAPADKKLYALRDATATVEAIPLIVASIMSKKLAAGLDALVLDVKTGSGAFMSKEDDARELARALVATGNSFGVHTEALLTDMSQPLGRAVGHAIEVRECIDILRGEEDERARPVKELSLELAARMVALAGVASSLESARERVQEALLSGNALECFRRNVEAQGGDPRVCDHPRQLLPLTEREVKVESTHTGFIESVDAAEIGHAVASIGGGRLRIEDKIDHAVGFAAEVKIGDSVKEGETLGLLYCRNETQAQLASERIRAAYKISGEHAHAPTLIKEVIKK